MNAGGCCTHCPTPDTVQVPGPEGDPGAAGTNGVNGINAFTLTTAIFAVPAINDLVTVAVGSTAWMGEGQNVYIPGAGYFSVEAIVSATSVQLRYLNYEVNTHEGDNIAIATSVSPGGTQPTAPALPDVDPIAAYASGTAYTVTTVDSPVVFGTSQPAISLTRAGYWRLTARVKLNYVGATFAASRNVTIKIRRTNNTASDVANAQTTFQTEIITTLSYTADVIVLPDVTYQTANVDDALTIYIVIDTGPTAGSLTVAEASIYAEFIHDN